VSSRMRVLDLSHLLAFLLLRLMTEIAPQEQEPFHAVSLAVCFCATHDATEKGPRIKLSQFRAPFNFFLLQCFNLPTVFQQTTRIASSHHLVTTSRSLETTSIL